MSIYEAYHKTISHTPEHSNILINHGMTTSNFVRVIFSKNFLCASVNSNLYSVLNTNMWLQKCPATNISYWLKPQISKLYYDITINRHSFINTRINIRIRATFSMVIIYIYTTRISPCWEVHLTISLNSNVVYILKYSHASNNNNQAVEGPLTNSPFSHLHDIIRYMHMCLIFRKLRRTCL